MNPVRVTREHRCPVCGKDTWCLVGKDAVLCTRVTSDRPKTFADGSVVYLHPAVETAQKLSTRTEPKPVTLDVAKTLESWKRGHWDKCALSRNLGVSVESLEAFGCIKAPYPEAYGFPMRDGSNTYCGIRIRNNHGDKWAERGSHQGLFIPQIPPQPTIFITEGITDACAGVSLGLYSLGRPSCCGGIPQIQVALKRLQVRRAVIVADLDDAGLRGARTLQEHLSIPSAILTVPSKDMRGAIKAGMDRAMVDALVGNLVWRNP